VDLSDALQALQGGLVVSVQAAPDTPLAVPGHMAALARAAAAGGAAGIRAEGVADVTAIKQAVGLPVIGLCKRRVPGSEVYLTPTLEDALAVSAAGADLVAVDATDRLRPDGRSGPQFVERLVVELGPKVLADVDCAAAGVAAREAGAAAVATTLSGYVGGGGAPPDPDVELVEALVEMVGCPVLAEGRYASPEQVRAAFAAGAFAVVVGTAITDPIALTRRFAEAAPSSPHGRAH
jgi:N-acylglucosamine-6-phosphate 2-epimerase